MRNRKRVVATIRASIGLPAVGASLAASHREAPLMAGDPTADITDVYAFVSYDQANLDRTPAQRRGAAPINNNPPRKPPPGPRHINIRDAEEDCHTNNNATRR